MRRLLIALTIALKIGLVLLLAHAILWPDLPQYAGKGIGSRLVLYPLGVVIVPVVWWIVARTRDADRRPRYPLGADVLISAPFTIDTLGNALNLFNTIDWWDDLMHFSQWALLLGGVGLLIERSIPGRVLRLVFIPALGALIALLWEVAEYFAFIRHSPELQTAYTDTLGDMVLGTLGATLTSVVLVLTERRRGGAGYRED